MENKKIVLSRPVIVNGKEITELEVRPVTVGDEEDAMQDAVNMKRSKNSVTVEMCVFARATRLPFDAIRSMRSIDYVKIRQAVNQMNGLAPQEENDEDPTTRI